MAKKESNPKGLEPLQTKALVKSLLDKVNGLIDESRYRVIVTVNSELALLYWNIGHHILKHILDNKRAAYGDQIVQLLSTQLTEKYGKGWGIKHLRHCLRTADTFSNEQIVSAVRRQLTWTHLRTIAYIDDQLKREFYIEMCTMEHWSTRQLEERIDSMLFERTAISKKPEDTIRQDLKLLKEEQKITAELVFRDPSTINFQPSTINHQLSTFN